MTAKDIRWIQRFNNFNKAFDQLKDAVELSTQRQLSKLEEQGGNGPRQSDRPYQSNYSHPYQMSLKVTRLIANTTEIEPERDPNKWIVESAANAYITSFKNTLQNYIVFDKTKQSKGSPEKKKWHMVKVLSH